MDERSIIDRLREIWKRIDPTIMRGCDFCSEGRTEVAVVMTQASALIAEAIEALEAARCEHAALLVGRAPTHRCKVCGALWILWPPNPDHIVPDLRDGSWSLFSLRCGKCCDNAPMGDQIEPLPKVLL